ncbi:MAG TPA: helix-turn-helix transcriptional regulator [Acidimicrobiales bacterium]
MGAREALAARRKAVGLTQESLAEALRVERSTVARWEQGTASPRPWYRRKLADALDVTPDELTRLLEPASTTSATPEQTEYWHGDVGDSHRPTSVASASYVESVRANARRLIELDTSYGGDDLARLAARAFRSAYERLASGLYVPGVERDLQAAIGELGQVAAWIAYDSDKQQLSRQLTNEALLHSRMAGDRRMELCELGQLAMQAVHLGRPAEALRIADEVIDSDPPSPRIDAVFRIRRARALAQMGDRSRSLREHDRAAAILGAGVTAADPDWTWWVDDAELAWHRAMSLASLDGWSAAVDLFQTAHDLRSPAAQRARYNDRAHLLEAQLAVGAWHDAEASLADILASTGDVRSSRTTALLRRIGRQLARADSAPSTVADSVHELLLTLDAPA